MCEIRLYGFLGMGRIHVELQKNSLMRAQENNTCGVSLFFRFLVTVSRFISLARASEKISPVPNTPRAHVKFASSTHSLNCEASYTYVAHCRKIEGKGRYVCFCIAFEPARLQGSKGEPSIKIGSRNRHHCS